MDLLLSGKKAIVTGGTSGLGRAIAVAYAKEGADVAIFGTNEGRAKQVVEELEKNKANPEQKMTHCLLDVSSTSEVDEAVASLLKEWGAIDILVNCAGITRDKLLMKMAEADWDDVMNVNLKSVYNLCHALIRPMMKAKQGKIINISSVIALTGNPGQVNYSASKSGMIGFTKSLAVEVGSRGISVNCIAPGFFKTNMTDALSDAQKSSIFSTIPMDRLGDPKEIADAALFLGSHMSNYVTGQTLTVDGGMLA